MYKVRLQPPKGEAYTIDIEALPMTIGRSIKSGLRLDDPFASRLHAELRLEGDRLYLSDLGSGNGTMVNDRRIGSDAPLLAGDQVRIGNTLLILANSDGGFPAAASTRPKPDDFVLRPRTTREDTGLVPLSRELAPAVAAVRQASSSRITALHREDLFTVLNKVGTALLSPASLPEVLNQILDLIFEGVEAERAYLLLKQGEDEALECVVASYRRNPSQLSEADQRISRSIIDRVIEDGEAVLTSDALADDRFQNRHSIILSSVRSAMAVPLSIAGRQLGMIYVDSPVTVNAFRDDDLRMLSTLATIAAVKIDNAMLVEQRLENERMRYELNNAHTIQSRLLPRVSPRLAHYDVAGTSSPCGEVGGDYFDFLPEADGGLLLTLGDVTGKGMDAALVMSSLHASVRTLHGSGARGVDLISRVNQFLADAIPDNRFVTFFLAELAADGSGLTYVNAGHNPPLLVREGGAIERLGLGGLPLGIEATAPYLSGAARLSPGDRLLIYSDGISEAADDTDEEFGSERLADVARRNPTVGSQELLRLVEARLNDFVGQTQLRDDVTLVVVGRC